MIAGVPTVESAQEVVRAKSHPYRLGWTRAIDRAIGAVVEPLAALLVLVEVAILAGGVFTRYVLRAPLVWTDELGTILFLWLAMLGSVVAYRRDEHIRLSVLVRRASPRVSEILTAVSSVVTAIFVIELMPASITFFRQEQIDVTPALSIPQSYVVLSIIVGLALILVIALLRLAETNLRVVTGVVAVTLLISAAAWFGRGAFAGLGNFNLVLFFIMLAKTQDDSHLRWSPASAPVVQKAPIAKISVVIDNERKLYYNGQQIGISQLKEAVEQGLKDSPPGGRGVLLKIDKETPAQVFEPVVEAVSQAGG